MAKGIRKLDAVVAKLLGPDGCPWDRRQTHRSLIPFLREEAAELADALKAGRWPDANRNASRRTWSLGILGSSGSGGVGAGRAAKVFGFSSGGFT